MCISNAYVYKMIRDYYFPQFAFHVVSFALPKIEVMYNVGPDLMVVFNPKLRIIIIIFVCVCMLGLPM